MKCISAKYTTSFGFENVVVILLKCFEEKNLLLSAYQEFAVASFGNWAHFLRHGILLTLFTFLMSAHLRIVIYRYHVGCSHRCYSGNDYGNGVTRRRTLRSQQVLCFYREIVFTIELTFKLDSTHYTATVLSAAGHLLSQRRDVIRRERSAQ